MAQEIGGESMKKVIIFTAAVFVVLAISVFAANALVNADINRNAATGKTYAAFTPEGKPGALAVAWILGPPTSYDITLNIKNLASGKKIRFVELNPLLAETADGRELIIDADGVFSVVAPPGGSATVLYPTNTALPGAMVEFTNFDYNEVASFSLDPDTFDDPAYGATVSEMQGCLIKVWFEDGETAGIGILKPHPTGHQVAVVMPM